MEKRKKKQRQEVAEKNKVLKRQKKPEKVEVVEAELWQRLKTVNRNLKRLTTLKKTKKKKECQKLC